MGHVEGLEMAKTADGVFEINVELSGTNSFGFVKNIGGDWDSFNSCRYTPATKGETPAPIPTAKLRKTCQSPNSIAHSSTKFDGG